MKLLRKITTLIMSCMVMVIGTTTAFAFDTINEPENWGNPVSQRQYEDENGTVILEKIYFDPDEEGIYTLSTSGKGQYKNEKTFLWDNGLSPSTTIYAQGYFVWGNGNVTVSNESGGYNYMPSSANITTNNAVPGTGGFITKNAFVDYTLTFTNVLGTRSSYTVTIKVSANGSVVQSFH